MSRRVLHTGRSLGFKIGEDWDRIVPIDDGIRELVTIGAIPGLVTPSMVNDEMTKMETYLTTLQASVDGAPKFDPATLTAWNTFTNEWRAWRQKNPTAAVLPISYLSQYNDVVNFEQRARAWEPRIAAQRGGTLAGPSIQPRPGNDANGSEPFWTPLHIFEAGALATIVLGTLAYIGIRRIAR